MRSQSTSIHFQEISRVLVGILCHLDAGNIIV